MKTSVKIGLGVTGLVIVVGSLLPQAPPPAPIPVPATSVTQAPIPTPDAITQTPVPTSDAVTQASPQPHSDHIRVCVGHHVRICS